MQYQIAMNIITILIIHFLTGLRQKQTAPLQYIYIGHVLNHCSPIAIHIANVYR